ncbi:MAG: hypothetical protein AAFR34_12750 [Pseudomonadota bacterium]
MTVRFSTLAGLTLALMLAVTSVAVGAVRGQADATGQIVICSGHGLMIVYTDADGAPTGAPHLCPDCVLKLLATVPAPTAPAGAGMVETQAYLVRAAAWDGASVTPYGPGARAPPRPV